MGCTCCNKNESTESKTQSSKLSKNAYDDMRSPQITETLEKAAAGDLSYYEVQEREIRSYQSSDICNVYKILGVSGKRAVITYKHKKDYETVASTLAVLSYKDPSKLTNCNRNSIYDKAQIHLAAKYCNSTMNNNKYTNEKGYGKVLHLMKHGKLTDSEEFSYFVTTNPLHGEDLKYHITQAKVRNCSEWVSSKAPSKIIKDILYSVKYLHDRNVVHRNITADNLKFSQGGMMAFLNRDRDEFEGRTDTKSRIVLIGYSNSYCFDQRLNRNYNCTNDKRHAYDVDDDELIWKERMQMLDNVVRINASDYNYCAPEIAFGEAFEEWELSQNIVENTTMDVFINLMKRRQQLYLKGQHGIETDENGLNDPQNLFGMTWEERYQEWEKYDTLRILENDDINKDLWDRYMNITPRMLKASDIWNVGIIAYLLVFGELPFRSKTKKHLLESSLICNYKVKLNSSYPLVQEFSVEYRSR